MEIGNQIMVPRELQHSGVLLVGHGTRDRAGLAEFSRTAQLVATLLPGMKIATAFIELADPNISDGVDGLVAAGVDRVVIAPVLLFAAGHAKRDMPAAIRSLEARYPQVQFVATEPLGCHPKLLQLSLQHWQAAWTADIANSTDAMWIIVGRGSLDAEATAEMHRYAQMLADRTGCRHYEVAFMAMAEPSLKTTLHRVPPTCCSILVQPHLLFQGDLLRALQEQVVAFSHERRGLRVQVANHIGPAPQLAEALAGEVLSSLDVLVARRKGAAP